MNLKLARISDISGCYRQPICSFIHNEFCVSQIILMENRSSWFPELRTVQHSQVETMDSTAIE